MILKLLGSIFIASVVSIFFLALSLFICKLIVSFYQLNYIGDTYWVFNVSFCVAIFFWILSFFFSLVIMKP